MGRGSKPGFSLESRVQKGPARRASKQQRGPAAAPRPRLGLRLLWDPPTSPAPAPRPRPLLGLRLPQDPPTSPATAPRPRPRRGLRLPRDLPTCRPRGIRRGRAQPSFVPQASEQQGRGKKRRPAPTGRTRRLSRLTYPIPAAEGSFRASPGSPSHRHPTSENESSEDARTRKAQAAWRGAGRAIPTAFRSFSLSLFF